MKIVLTLVVLLSTGLTASVEAKGGKTVREPASKARPRELGSDASRVLEIVQKSCPDKLSEAMKGANGISKVLYAEQTFANGGEEWTWSILTVSRTGAPSFQETSVATLVIDWKAEPPPADRLDGGTDWNITCRILH